jgi:hypothetical protein
MLQLRNQFAPSCTDDKAASAGTKDKSRAALSSVAMLKAFEFCLPTAAKAVPVGPGWMHEVK